MTTPQRAVVASGLTRRFGDVTALDGVDLEIEFGRVVGLLGHNGAGKSTTVNILTTLLLPTAGRAEVCGHDVVRDPRAVRESIALAGQQATLDELLTGRENLVLLGCLLGLSRRDAKARAAELLERFLLADAADRVCGGYSGGMRRRLDLAACLLVPRPVVLLDEPTTGLDPASRLEVWAAVRELVDDGTALLLTTQYLEEADRLADTVVVLAGGRVVAEGTPSEMKDRVGGRRVEVVLASASDVDRARDTLATVAGLDAAPEHRLSSVSAPAPRGSLDLEAALEALRGAGIEPVEAGLRRPTLDDAFLALTGRPVQSEPESEDIPELKEVAA
jgi:ABC-2 type transport system ATP-binding protein